VELTVSARAVVRIEIKEELVSRRIGPLPVQVRAEAGGDLSRVFVKPAQVDITLTGALLAVEHAIAAGIVPQVKVSAGELMGRSEVTVAVSTAVPGVGITITPPRVRLQRR
jgi:hypothetical protein